MKVLDLFSGIGGFSLGLERAGMRTVAFCEIEPYCRAVLRKHWPDVPIYDDVRTLTAARLAADGIGVDLICGGFPCQDISTAGKGAGIGGERSGLWREYSRLIGELRPRYVIVENVAALLGRGLDVVLGDLAALGFDAEWHCIPASAVGAPHRRDRIWIVAYPNGSRAAQPARGERERGLGTILGSEALADASIDGRKPRWARDAEEVAGRGQSGRSAERSHVAYANRPRLALWESLAGNYGEEQPAFERGRLHVPDADCFGAQIPASRGYAAIEMPECARWWATEPDVGRVAHGIPARVDRLGGLGNAVVPQIPEIIGRAILAAEATL